MTCRMLFINLQSIHKLASKIGFEPLLSLLPVPLSILRVCHNHVLKW